MLVARRDPPFDVERAGRCARQSERVPGSTRRRSWRDLVTAIQIGRLAVGCSSGHSQRVFVLSRQFFSRDHLPEPAQRSIVAMLDRSVDAATRRVLVRSDVGGVREDLRVRSTPMPLRHSRHSSRSIRRLLPAARRSQAFRKYNAAKQCRRRKPCARPSRGHKRPPPGSRLQPQAPVVAGARTYAIQLISDTQWLDAVRAGVGHS